MKNIVEFETIGECDRIKLRKGFLVVELNKAVSEEGERTFVSVKKVDENGRFKQTLTFPIDEEVVNGLIAALQSVA